MAVGKGEQAPVQQNGQHPADAWLRAASARQTEAEVGATQQPGSTQVGSPSTPASEPSSAGGDGPGDGTRVRDGETDGTVVRDPQSAALEHQVALARQSAERAVQAQRAAEEAARQAVQAQQRMLSEGYGQRSSSDSRQAPKSGSYWRLVAADARRHFLSLPFLIMIIASIGLNIAAMAGTASGLLKHQTSKSLDVTAFTHSIVGLGFGGATLLSMVFGTITITRDFGSGFVIRESFLAGGAERLWLAKLASIFPPLLVFGLTAPPTGLIFTAIRLQSFDKSPEFDKKTWIILVGLVFVAVATGYFGHFIGWLIRNSIISVVVVAGWTLVLEGYLIKLMDRKGQLLPGGAMQTLLRDDSTIHHLYPGWSGYLIYVGWLALLAVAVIVRLRRTDLV